MNELDIIYKYTCYALPEEVDNDDRKSVVMFIGLDTIKKVNIYNPFRAYNFSGDIYKTSF